MCNNYDIVAGFNAIASGYDTANDAMTFGMHRLWRRKLINRALSFCPNGARVLDLATGTGDVAIGVSGGRSDIIVDAVDPAEEMLKIARAKAAAAHNFDSKQLVFSIGDARKLEFPDNSFDVVTIAWGIRNVVPFADGLREIIRVLKPGGRLLILESGKPEYSLIGKLYKLYSKLVPYIGGAISGYRKAYQYYIKSSDTFISGKEFLSELNTSGFNNCRYDVLGFGLIFLYEAQKPD